MDMAEIVSQGQQVIGQRRRWIEVFVVAFIGALVAIAIAWAAMSAGAPKVAPQGTTGGYLREPGLLLQRSSERGVDSTFGGGSQFGPALQQHRSGERQGD
jgi:hypothetical protein